MSDLDDLLANERPLDVADVPAPPAKHVAIVTCMDARIDPVALLGLEPGDAHVIRNAGGIVTDAELRSLAISQRKLGTTAVAVITHTQCGMATFRDEDFVAELRDEVGEAPAWAPGAFGDPAEAARAGAEAVRSSAFIPHTDDVRAFVLDLQQGKLTSAEN